MTDLRRDRHVAPLRKHSSGKKARQPDSEEALGECNLGIEGFLIHLRNPIAFFTTKHSLKGSDLRFGSPRGLVWKALDETKYSDLRDQVQALNAGYSETFKNANTPSDCYDLISKDTFLLRLFHHNCRPVTVCRTRMSDTKAANALPPFPKTAPV